MSRSDWKTPKLLYERLDKIFNFNFDPCPPKPAFDALVTECEWGSRSFVNPPYDALRPWLLKALEEREKRKFIILLLPAKTDTRWWQELVQPNAAFIWFLKSRLYFDDGEGRAPFPSAVVCFYKYAEIGKAR